ncbi:serine/threonine-protein kinase [Knoellia aerolata]|uniref:non-specific serine/threonine protein kinase n=1 Tax=Knoellia aerolata DSM 18566 TaxID=1385519 RepID=A0A0A0JTC7_9MICO|nr:serine/threonine-protein kinase [Knoellia aerolata]KGN38901.1 hypothetical protein N801_19985 [Knoellia aerolata DSM 18566]
METARLTAPPTYAGRHRAVDHDAPRVAGYEVVGPLARGGSGTVWSATAPSGDPVAIKVVPATDADDALVELAVLGRITDPHLVRLHEAVALPSGEVALVLDHLPGGTVGSVVRARGHLAAGEVVTVLSPIASTLARLHAAGVVHGDVSPDNVLLDLDGRPFLADLGVARIAGERSAEARGTEGFVAPEVVLGAVPTAASDVHALGALAWFCLTGDAPDLAGVRVRLGDLVPGLPGALVEAVEGALRLRPEGRPGADELALALFESAPAEPLLLAGGGDDVSLLTRRIRAAARAEAVGGTSGRAGWAGRLGRVGWVALRHRLARTRTWAGAAVAVVAVVSLAVAAVSWVGGLGESEPSSAPRASQASSRSPAPAPDLRLVADAPVRDPVGLVRALAAARADAWATGIAARLVEVDAPGSPALARDTEVLAGVQRARQRYVGLTFVVREASVVGEDADVVTVRARIDTGAHVVRGPRGDEPRPATSAAPVLLDLVRTGSGWRVRDVRSA